MFLAILAFSLASPVYGAADNMTLPMDIVSDGCLPFTMPPDNIILTSKKKVFVNYYLRHPLSIDNKIWIDDYYSRNYLQPHGEKDKWLPQGGFFRARPLPVPVLPEPDYKVENIKKEIRLAISRGIGGFVFDTLTVDDVGSNGYWDDVLKAVSEVDPRFKIIFSPSVSSLKNGMADVKTVIEKVYDNQSPSLFRASDGRLVVAPFNPEVFPASDWVKLKAELEAEHKYISLWPMFLSVNKEYENSFEGFSDGFAYWGAPTAEDYDNNMKSAMDAHARGKLYMAGIEPQGYRPKDYIYYEPQGSLGYRKSWEGSIKGDSDFVQLVTWSDFSESTQIEPYTDLSGSSGTGYFNLTGYYSSWFLTGQQPEITHDVLYYFYRKEPIEANAPNARKKTRPAFSNVHGVDIIELVGFLTEPGTLSIEIGGKKFTKDVAAGVQDFQAPLSEGTPIFSLVRKNTPIISFAGTTYIANKFGLPNGFADLTYWSGSASAKATCFSKAMK